MGYIERDIIVNGTLKVEQPIEFKDSKYPQSNYCLQCWNEFTMLSDEEKQILKGITPDDVQKILLKLCREKYQNERKQRSKKIKCLETGQIFASVKHCADILNISEKVVYRAIDCFKRGQNYKAGRKYKLEYA